MAPCIRFRTVSECVSVSECTETELNICMTVDISSADLVRIPLLCARNAANGKGGSCNVQDPDPQQAEIIVKIADSEPLAHKVKIVAIPVPSNDCSECEKCVIVLVSGVKGDGIELLCHCRTELIVAENPNNKSGTYMYAIFNDVGLAWLRKHKQKSGEPARDLKLIFRVFSFLHS